MEKEIHGRARYGKKNGQAGRSSVLVLKMFGLRTTEASEHKRAWQHFFNVFRSLKTAVSLPRSKEMEG